MKVVRASLENSRPQDQKESVDFQYRPLFEIFEKRGIINSVRVMNRVGIFFLICCFIHCVCVCVCVCVCDFIQIIVINLVGQVWYL